MQSSGRKLLTRSGRREFPAAVPYDPARVAPAAPRPGRACEFPSVEAPTRIDLAYDYRDQESWHAPPRHSVIRRIAVVPAPASERAPSSRLHHWSAKLLLASILAAIVALLGFFLLSVVARA